MDQAAILDGRATASSEIAHLLQRVANQDSSALKALYGRTSAKLYGICLRMLGDDAEAQDAMQDIYVAVWRKAGSFDAAKASGMTWLATLARNKAIDRLRRRRDVVADFDEALAIADDGPSSLEVMERAEDASRLAHCLDELEERARAMIRTAFFDGATYRQLAEREGVPLPTMKSWIRRGLLSLRGCLEQ